MLEPDRTQIELFTAALFCRAGQDGYVSVRAFYEDNSAKPFRITPVSMTGGLPFLNEVAEDDARRAANAPGKVVFCPVIAVFANKDRAREQDLVEGLALSVECDQHPQEAKAKLEGILGPVTVTVRSGGAWTDPQTGEVHDKLHLHWRLRVPARGSSDLAKLKQARDIAAHLVGGDPSNKPVCHPIRWPGSWHRKGEPRLCEIATVDSTLEVDLDAALAALKAAAPASEGNGADHVPPEGWEELIAGIARGENYHDAIARLAMKLLKAGMSDGAAVNMLRASMNTAAGERDERWRSRYADIPRAVRTAREKIGGEHSEAASGQGPTLSLDNFHAYMEQHSYIYTPTRQPWPASSVNARLGSQPVFDNAGNPKLNKKGEQETIPASTWLDRNKPIEQMTWAPGLPMLIRGRVVSHGGWLNEPGVTCFNLYLPPTIAPGNAAEADPWLSHVSKIYPNDAEHIILWLAHRKQRPEDKINHALVLGGPQGIGKDTLLEPAKQAIGPWNFIEVSPAHMLGRFNGFLKSVILRVSEARDLGDVNRYQFYDHMKAYTAAPPDVLRVDEKNLREHSVINCCGVIITSNHKSDGIYLPADDRRHYVAWSDLTKDDFPAGYWKSLWGWYAQGGYRHVAAYLAELDISGFDPKAPPPKTEAFWAIVDANRAPEDAELQDVLDRMGNPAATTIARIAAEAAGDFQVWLYDRKNRRVIPHRLESCEYVPVRNPDSKQGLWQIHSTRQAVYAKNSLSVRDQLNAARKLR